MIEKGSFKWDARKEEASILLARGELTNEEIAEKLDMGIATLFRWKNYQEFKERVEELVTVFREEALKQEIGDLGKRLKRYNKRWQQIDQLIKERSTAEKNQNVAGGTTGLLAMDVKGEVNVWKFDAALLKEERELAKQAAIELGQWEEKSKVDSTLQVVGLDEALDRAYGKPT